jgi:hypothetical protein
MIMNIKSNILMIFTLETETEHATVGIVANDLKQAQGLANLCGLHDELHPPTLKEILELLAVYPLADDNMANSIDTDKVWIMSNKVELKTPQPVGVLFCEGGFNDIKLDVKKDKIDDVSFP